MLQFEFYKICKQKMIFFAFGILLLYAVVAVLEIYHPDHWNNIVSYEGGETVNGKEGLAINQRQAKRYAGELTDELVAEVLHNDSGMSDTTTSYFMNFREEDNDHVLTVREAYPFIDFKLTYGYSDSWESFLYSYYGLMSLFPFFIVAAFSSLFSYEIHCGMSAIMHTTQYGKIKSARAKILVSVILTNIAFVVVTFVRVIGFLIRYGMDGSETSIQIGKSGYFYKSQIPMHYLELSIHYILLSLVCVNMILLIVLIVSLKSKGMIQALIVSVVLLYIFNPTAIYTMTKSDKLFDLFSLFPINVLKITSVTSDFAPVVIFGYPLQWIYVIEIFYVLALGIGFYLLCSKLVKNQKYYSE